MQAGRLRHRITIQRNTPTVAPSGGQVDSWANHVTNVPAQKRIARASERYSGQADQVVARVPYHFEIRFLADVTEEDRVIFEGKALDILAAYDPDGRRRVTRLDCVHVPARRDDPG